ncbi:MAG: hypothetical protein V5A27_10995 [Halapricum sp.]
MRSIRNRRTAVTITGQAAAAEQSTDDDTEITVVARGDEPVVTRTVPRAWYEHVSAVDRTARVHADRFGGTRGVEHLRLVRAGGNIGGHGRLGVAVLLGDDGPVDSIPAEINGVSVESRHAKPQTFTDLGSDSCIDRETRLAYVFLSRRARFDTSWSD